VRLVLQEVTVLLARSVLPAKREHVVQQVPLVKWVHVVQLVKLEAMEVTVLLVRLDSRVM
jgi:hypothetical protein